MKWPLQNKQLSLPFDSDIFNDRRKEAQFWRSKKYSQLFLANRSFNCINVFSNFEFALFGLSKASLRVFRSVLVLFKRQCDFPQDRKVAIVFDLTRQHLPPAVMPNELDEFFFDPQRNFLKSETRVVVLIIQTSKVNEKLTDRIFTSPSLSNLVLGSQINFASKSRLLIKALFKTIKSVRLSRNFLNTLGILPDIFDVNILKAANLYREIDTVFVTNSSFYTFPSIFYLNRSMRQFKTVMLHYSENSLPLTDLEFQESGLPKWIFSSRIDIHKVWTIEYAKFLTSVNPALVVNAVGSLIFRPRNLEIKRKNAESNRNQILLLDVYPSIFESKNGPYTELAGKRFLECIENIYPLLISGYEPKPIFKIKSKRRRIPGISVKYLDQKDDLVKRGVIEEVSWDTNLYTLIAESNVVLCSVGTSPALIARELEIPVAMFYEGENKLMEPLVDYGIPLLENHFAVYTFISGHLATK